MVALTYRDALRKALADAMAEDPDIIILGEEVGRYGGAYGVTRDLIREFGPGRVLDTPISEPAIVGAAVGAAMTGLRPVAELMYVDFLGMAMDQLANQAAKIRYMFGGQARPSVVVRMPHGIWRNSAAQHSQMLESWFVHLPGVVVVTPATPADAAGLLVSAIRSDDPVLFFDPKNLFPVTGEVASVIEPIPFGKARKVREGTDLTLVSWSAILPAVEQAAATLAQSGISVDLIDLRTLWPWDRDAVCASVEKTGRLLVVHEAVAAAGFGAEVVTSVIETLGPARVKAARRLGAPRIPIPFSPPLEDVVKVTPDKIVAAARQVVSG